MNRAVPHHVSPRSSTRSGSRRVTARKQKVPASPPAPPRPSDEERRAALAQAHQALRTQLWAGLGTIVHQDDQLTVHCGQLSRGRPHWHLVTEGLALKGFELSVRVQKEKEELAPPAWAIELLKTLANEAELAADTNQVLVLAQGVAPGSDSELGGVIFTPDPEANSLSTAHDRVPLLLSVPVTRDETRAVREWAPTGLIEVLSKLDHLLITHLDRPSLLQSPRARALIEQRMEREGSSLSSMTATTSLVSKSGEHVSWKLSVDAVDTLSSLLKGRIAHQRPFSVVSGHTRVDVVNGAPARAELSSARHLTLHLTLVAARQLRSLLKAKPGSYTFDQLPNFTLTVV